MWSCSGSALLPSSVTIVPFTETAPEVISFSALRREAIPAAAMIFWRRSEGMLRKDYQENVLRLLGHRQLLRNLFDCWYGQNRSVGALVFQHLHGDVCLIDSAVLGRA